MQSNPQTVKCMAKFGIKPAHVLRFSIPFERWYCDLLLTRIHEGTDESQHFIIARALLKRYVKIGAWK